MHAATLVCESSTGQSQVVGLGAAGGEDYLLIFYVKAFCNGGSGILQILLR